MTTNEGVPAVYVPFVLTKRGKRTIQFAGDIARLLERDLVIVLESLPACEAFAKQVGVVTSDETNLICETVADIAKIAIEKCSIVYVDEVIPHGAIRVTSEGRLWDPHPKEITLYSSDETGLFARGKGPLYVPAGDEGTNSVAINEATSLAKKLGVALVLYHSTWKVAHSESADPLDHTNDNALKVLSVAVRIAKEAEVPVSVVLEYAPTIVDGVLQHAIKHGASAIVMTKSARARKGSYVDQAVLHSPVPIFVAPRECPGTLVEDLPPADTDLPIVREEIKDEAPRGVAYYVMLGVLLMYVVKVIAKVAIGTYLRSPVIEGDGWHNASDIFEAIIVIATIYLANLPTSPHYPYGWKNLEHIFGVLVGISLGWMGLSILKSSLLSIVVMFPGVTETLSQYFSIPKHEALLMGPQYFPWAVGVMAFSVALSLIVSRVQISCGKKYGYPSIVADGYETLSDGRIEGAALVGILGEYSFGLPQIEYFLGAVIAYLILHASYEMAQNSVKGLLQHSIGDDKEKEIRKLAEETRGIFDVMELKTFITGSSAVIIMKAVTKVLRSEHLRVALANRVIDYCMANGFTKAECHVRFSESHRPQTEQVERVAFAVIASSGDPYVAIIAPSLASATHIVVADDEKYRGRRSFIDLKPKDIPQYFIEKHVKKFYVYSNVSLADAKIAETAGVLVTPLPTYHLEIFGA